MWKFKYKYFCGHSFILLRDLSINDRCMISEYLALWKLPLCFLKWVSHAAFPAMYGDSFIQLHRLSIGSLWMWPFKWMYACVFCGFILYFLMINDVEHIFTYLIIHVSLVKHVIKIFVVKLGFLVIQFILKFWILVIYQIYFANIFPWVWLAFLTLLNVSF